MTVQILLMLMGIALVVFGANYFIDGTSAVGKRIGASDLVIGLTVVALATFLPELFVCYYSQIIDVPQVTVGNIVGSNIFNIALILGITAIITPIAISKKNMVRDLPVNLLAAILLIVFGMSFTIFKMGDNIYNRFEGAIFVILYITYLYILLKNDARTIEEDSKEDKKINTWVALLMLFLGLGALIFGSRLLVNAAVKVAEGLGVSESFIAITIVAGGTSLPELVTCIVAAAKGRNQIALGNIIGSNISNIFLIIGGSAIIRPIIVEGITWIDLAMSLILPLFLLLVPLISKKKVIGRGGGIVLVLMFAGYMVWLISQL